ncbi:MAG: hypothetical protein NTW25_00300 [Candidatus Kapabacteria bacterium]|nr:hypothetical protein [Candidatus Kapabacteria bacterium]
MRTYYPIEFDFETRLAMELKNMRAELIEAEKGEITHTYTTTRNKRQCFVIRRVRKPQPKNDTMSRYKKTI